MIQLPQLDTGIQVDAILDLSNNSQYRDNDNGASIMAILYSSICSPNEYYD